MMVFDTVLLGFLAEKGEGFQAFINFVRTRMSR